MTLLSVLRAQLAAVLATAVGVGQVHDYFRKAEHDVQIADLFKSEGRLHVWFLTLADDTPYTEQRKPAGCSEATVRYSIHGYFALEDADASEKAFETVLQAVISVLRADPSLGLPDTVINAGPPAVTTLGHATFVGVLSHYARIDVSVRAHLEG